MKLETYLKYRKLFDSRYRLQQTMCGETVLKPMLDGMRNRHLFFMLYSYDRRVWSGTQGVNSIDKHIRYYTYQGKSCTRIRKPSLQTSMIDKFGNYDKLLIYCKQVLETKNIKR